MRRFGHHTRGECDVALPRWAEQPEYVLRLVKSAAGFIDHPLPTANVGDVQGGRTALIQELGDRLSGMRRRVFLGVASRIAPYARLRDQHQSESMRRIFLARTALLETGLRLQRMDIVDDPNDVFFLVLEEVRAALLGVLDPAWDLRSRVLERRAQSDGHRQHAPPPQVVVGPRRDGPESLDVRLQAGDEPHALRGVGASPGVVEGMIRVITANDNQHTILPGEVLVAPFTDAGWAPYFVHAAAIIIDSGDALSSGSTLAREMGIPAVVQVGGASRRLRTGQRVRVDGLRGEVMVLADIPQAAHDDPAQAA